MKGGVKNEDLVLKFAMEMNVRSGEIETLMEEKMAIILKEHKKGPKKKY